MKETRITTIIFRDAWFTAIGALARWITENHPTQYGYSPSLPPAKLCEVRGKALLLGTPLNSITLLHYAEHMTNVPNKRIIRYKMPVLRNVKRVWVEIKEFDTCKGIVANAEEYFTTIADEYIPSGKGYSRKVGTVQSYLLDAFDLTKFAI